MSEGRSQEGNPEGLIERLAAAWKFRQPLLSEAHHEAIRLFNGFYEGFPEAVIDLMARTLVVYNYADPPEANQKELDQAIVFLRKALPWVSCVIQKDRHASEASGRRGRVVFGERPDRRIREHGVWYALDLCMNQDASFYIETRNLRLWALQNLAGQTVLNTFAYTGSYGVAASVGGAARVVHIDLNRRALNLAKSSYSLNSLAVKRGDFLRGDFWILTSRLLRAGERFDCVFLDPPFFSKTPYGTVDLIQRGKRVINKVRPLVEDGGYLVAVNNALFVSGAEYLHSLEELCADGYVSIEDLIPIPEDVCGYPETRIGTSPADPAPFNHATKIAILRARRKSK